MRDHNIAEEAISTYDDTIPTTNVATSTNRRTPRAPLARPVSDAARAAKQGPTEPATPAANAKAGVTPACRESDPRNASTISTAY
jgi:hypothetical protein